jgi:hypothetical protein
MYKNVGEQLALLRQDAMDQNVWPSYDMGEIQLDIFEPLQGYAPSTGWWY